MPFPLNKTRIICTIGPASASPEILEKMMKAGMDVARINFSHGDYDGHRVMIEAVRAAARATGRRVAIMADLPGPKLRIGELKEEPVRVKAGDEFILTTDPIEGNRERVSVSFARLPEVVRKDDRMFINDGLIELQVTAVDGSEVKCRVIVGGQLQSRKGLNLPGIELGIQAFTERDHEGLVFAKEMNLDAVSQSFVENGDDVLAVRTAAKKMAYDPFIIAKIERSNALDHIDEILKAADGIMIARGDLGVEIPIEQMAVAQKRLMRQANLRGKPVITATQMLESMTNNRRPTRAEATDVANAILDGTDCVMLSGESAMGKYPVAAVSMLAKIAANIEPHRPDYSLYESLTHYDRRDEPRPADLIALCVETTLKRITPPTVIVPTRSGATARSITRFRLPVWITAVSSLDQTCQNLMFSYGVLPFHEPDHPDDWKAWTREYLNKWNLEGDFVVLTEGPSKKHPDRNNRMEILDLNNRFKKS